MRRTIVALLVTACALAPLAATAAVQPRSGSPTEVRTGTPKARTTQRVVKKRTAHRPARKPGTVKAAKKTPAKRATSAVDIRV